MKSARPLNSWHICLLVIAAGFLVYARTLFFSYTYLDDNILILQAKSFLANPLNIITSFKQGIFYNQPDNVFYYRPVLTVSFVLNELVRNFCPLIYRFTNIFLHVFAGCIVFLLFRKLQYKQSFAFLAAMVFTVHPALSQAVAWLPGRNDSLLAIFVLLSFIAFLDYCKSRSYSSYFCHILFFALALFTKETAFVILPICIYYLYSIVKEKKFSVSWKVLLTRWICVSFIYLFLRRIAFLNGNYYQWSFLDIVPKAYFNLPAVIVYFGKILFPFNLSVLPILQDSRLIYGIISIVILTIFLYFSKNKRPKFIILGITWIILFLLPCLTRPAGAVTYLHENRLYVPIIGFFILLSEIDVIKNFDLNNSKTRVFSAVLLIVLSRITILHSSNFQNGLKFWKNAAENSPHSALAHRYLGDMYSLNAKLQDAQSEYQKALAINKAELPVHNNLAIVYINMGRLKEAEAEFKEEIRLHPDYKEAYSNLDKLYPMQGNKN